MSAMKARQMHRNATNRMGKAGIGRQMAQGKIKTRMAKRGGRR